MAPIPSKQTLINMYLRASPTPLDRLINSRNLFFGFAAIIVGVSAYVILKDDAPSGMTLDDPHGDPREWTEGELRGFLTRRNINLPDTASRDQLEQQVRVTIATARTPLLPRE
ncbi:hypothetical protein BZA77DRAFT_17666 [Pyronema omphalodes]|nr:hypothetical protein BZA77DRAFT_17666 [Pyronema omphalodes]